jgi:hypothetical protein
MDVYTTFWAWASGDYNETFTIGLRGARTGYLVQTYLTAKDGGDYAHAYIAETCTEAGDLIQCAISDEGDADSVEILPSDAISVTLGVRTTGGYARAEGTIFSF